jgi:hypothetical protein
MREAAASSFTELTVGWDGLSIIANPANDFVSVSRRGAPAHLGAQQRGHDLA